MWPYPGPYQMMPPYYPPMSPTPTPRSKSEIKALIRDHLAWETFLEERKKKEEEKKKKDEKKASSPADYFLFLICFLTVAQIGYFFLAVQLVKALR